jgi:hypothetical protein
MLRLSELICTIRHFACSMLVGLAVKSTFVVENQDPGIRFTCSTTSCVKIEVGAWHFDSFTCFRDNLEA